MAADRIGDTTLSRILLGDFENKDLVNAAAMVQSMARELRDHRDASNLGYMHRNIGELGFDGLSANHVEILCDSHGKLWVNVDNVCRLRIGKVKTINVDVTGEPQWREFPV